MEVGHTPSYTSFWPANVGLRRTDGTQGGRLPSTVVDEGGELARRFIIRASTREALEEHAASEVIRRAAATRFWPMKTFEPGTLCFFYRHNPGKRAETAM